ncbi:MAG: hypothetical protein AUK27_10310 [Deltaproteobacteria bacterium CG2_30_66_27]|nr:MAG: hypothetical protein AUK27_10310 [Deltaproteobacteria bacterium CG2_30_66_27]PJB32056.1 MAG: hypothetical protein CO109_06705 [Deltaproteobacteria bacterium CG_4_9_14_3_um_filter_65_9]
MPGEYELKNGSVVAIIGGGPAGCSCAIKLRQLAVEKGIRLRIILFESKDFNLHHNQCVGVLSPPIEKILKKELSISIPQELIKRKIMGYHISSGKSELLLQSNNEEDPTYVVRRVKFDKFVLDEVVKAGIEVIHSRVTDIEFIDRNSKCEVRVYSESCTIRADVVVGAFGLDEGSLHMLEDSTRNRGRYVRPRMVMHTFITKVHPDSSEFINEKLGYIIHAFLLSSLPKIEFGAITPKGDHIIVNIAGEHVTSVDLENFLKHPAVAKFLPPSHVDIDQMVSYKGHFPTSPAKNPYGDRYITVGDSTGWLRPFKGKGITTAVMTGISAAKAMIYHGISKRGLDAYAAECEYLTKDYPYGTLVRFCSNLAVTTNYYDFLIEYAKKEERLSKIFYDSVSGHRSYKDILFEKGNFRLFAKLGVKFVENIVGR